MQITPKQDSACVRGTIESILTDSHCPNAVKVAVLTEINRRTTGTNTNLHPTEVKQVMGNCFAAFDHMPVQNEGAFANLGAVDNEKSFAILFWNGDGKGNNHHCTRFISKAGDQITYVEPGTGQISSLKLAELFQRAPQGFDFVRMSNS